MKLKQFYNKRTENILGYICLIVGLGSFICFYYYPYIAALLFALLVIIILIIALLESIKD